MIVCNSTLQVEIADVECWDEQLQLLGKQNEMR